MKRLALAFFAATLVGLYFSSHFYVNFAPDEAANLAWIARSR